MSLAFESPIHNDSEQQNDVDDNNSHEQQEQPQRKFSSKDPSYNDDDELDFEEDEPSSHKLSNDSIKNFNDDDNIDSNEIDHFDNNKQQQSSMSKESIKQSVNIKPKKEKDEGEIDSDDELEEGEVKEDDSEEDNSLKNSKLQSANHDENSFGNNNNSTINDNLKRPLLPQERKNYYNTQQHPYYYPNRYMPPRVDRYGNQIVRGKDPILPTPINHKSKIQSPHQSLTTESAWERGLKQARELISRASKRKEVEEDLDNKLEEHEKSRSPILEQLPQSSSVLGGVPLEKRRRHSSSEDEMERRHRLAYDAAPWNDPPEQGSSGQPYSSTSSSSNYRPRSNYYGSQFNRTDSYRDPWRRSKSPQAKQNAYRNRDIPAGARYGELFYNKKLNDKSRSESMSSLSSICSSSSNGSRKLPYSRPSPDSRSRFMDNVHNENSNKSKGFARIPKKSNASSVALKKDDDDRSAKSFDSWSESLSDSDSYYSASDSDDGNHPHPTDSVNSKRNNAARLSTSSSNKTRRSSDENRLIRSSSKSRHYHNDDDANIKNMNKPSLKGDHAITNVKKSKAEMAGKVPIKMTFMKKQQSIKQDTIINEQLNGSNLSDDMDENSSFSKISQKSLQSNRSLYDNNDDFVDDEQEFNIEDDSQMSTKSSEKEVSLAKNHRREELLMKLKAVEEAIERKLSSKN